MTGQPLAGRRIVVTRPRELAAGLAAAIRAAGGQPLLVPAIEIRDIEDHGPFQAVVSRLEEFRWAIFVSPMAVRKALALLRAERAAAAWPARLQVAAIGRGSQRALQEEGFSAVVASTGTADSEGLLAMPQFARFDGERIVIFRGRGGRERLGDSLTARGARVEYAECYVRARPEPGKHDAAIASGAQPIDAVTISSAEGLANLLDMLDGPGREHLLRAPLLVPHPRVAEQAAALGAVTVRLAGPSDAEMLAALVAYFGRTQP